MLRVGMSKASFEGKTPGEAKEKAKANAGAETKAAGEKAVAEKAPAEKCSAEKAAANAKVALFIIDVCMCVVRVYYISREYPVG